jgi:hypothetical protein
MEVAMSTLTAITILVGTAVCALTVWYVVRILRVWQQYRGDRVVTCPETGHPAAVRIDAAHAALTGAKGAANVRLAACSRWATRGRCDEPCLFEAADSCSTVATIASGWYDGKRCVYCRKPIIDEPFVAHHPALLGSDGTTREWVDVKPDRLPDALRTGRPVCWDCHVAETFRRQYPSLVTDRTNVRHAS